MHDDRGEFRDCRFGPAPEQLVISLHQRDYQQATRPDLTLTTSQGDILFKLEPKDDGDAELQDVRSVFRAPLRGYAQRKIVQRLTQTRGKVQYVSDVYNEEPALLTIACALLMARYTIPLPQIPASRLFTVARLLFDNQDIDLPHIEQYATVCLQADLQDFDHVPRVALNDSAYGDDYSNKVELWRIERLIIVHLGELVYTLAQVGNIDIFEEIPLFEGEWAFRRLNIAERPSTSWLHTGTSTCFQADATYNLKILSLFMVGDLGLSQDIIRTSLISSARWSIFLGTITEADPYDISKSNAITISLRPLGLR